MLKRIIGSLVGKLIDEVVTEENYEDIADDVLDFFERLAAKTDNTIDDKAVAAIRRVLKIPDGDD